MPTKLVERRKWIQAIQANEKEQPFENYTKYYDICELHFKKEDIIMIENKQKLREGVVPSIFNR